MTEVERLERLLQGNPGAPAFAALADAHRREGRVEEALRIARAGLARSPRQVAGRVVLGRALADLGRVSDAQREFERVLDAVPHHPLADGPGAVPELRGPQDALDALADVNDHELDRAFAEAETERESVLDASQVAHEAMLAHDLDAPEFGDLDSPFATATMAELLERQGHSQPAEAIRSALASHEKTLPTREATASPHPSRVRVLSTLERWLKNLRRGELR